MLITLAALRCTHAFKNKKGEKSKAKDNLLYILLTTGILPIRGSLMNRQTVQTIMRLLELIEIAASVRCMSKLQFEMFVVKIKFFGAI